MRDIVHQLYFLNFLSIEKNCLRNVIKITSNISFNKIKNINLHTEFTYEVIAIQEIYLNI